MNGNEDSVRFRPDGLTEQMIDALLSEVDTAALAGQQPTSALVDGSAAERCRRRMERRAVAAVLRELPVRPDVAGPDGQQAA